MGALMLQANNVFKRLRGQWTVQCEAQRLRVTDYPLGSYHSTGGPADRCGPPPGHPRGPGHVRDPLLPDAHLAAAECGQVGVGRLLSQRHGGGRHPTGDARGFHQAGRLLGVSPTRHACRGASAHDDDETLTYLHNGVSDRWHSVRLPALPIDLDAMLCDRPWHGGWYPSFGTAPLVPGAPDDRTHVRLCSIQSYPPHSLANALQAIDHLRFPYRWSTRWIAMERQTQEYLLARTQRQWLGQEKTMRDRLMEKATRQETGC